MLQPDLLRSVLALLLLALLCACQDKSLLPGTVACVNGEPIHLSLVQALQDSRSAGLGIPQHPSVSEMQKNYRHALATLIAHTLVRQELAERGLAIDEATLDEAITRVKNDFGGENLESFLAESSLREDEWRQLMRDHLSLEAFTARLLLPAIRIPLEEVRAYYETNSREFNLPAYGRVCFLAAEAKEDIEEWCAAVGEDESHGQCVDMALKDLPEPWSRNLPKQGSCGTIVRQEGFWRTVTVLEKTPAAKPRLSEVYGLIENILLAERRQAAFEDWLQKKLATSEVLVNPELFETGTSSDF